MVQKISIITIFDVPNVGTFLQAVALSKKLSQQGYSVEIIKFRRKQNLISSRLKNQKSVISFLKTCVHALIDQFSLNKQIQQIQKYVSITHQEYNSNKELRENLPLADIYMTGSDQVWNSEHNNGLEKAFFLSFVPENKPKFAYAASIGMNHFPITEKEETIKLLKRYKKISVREKSAQELLENSGIKNVEFVLDPTLLLDKKEWSTYVKTRKIKEPYLLIYSVESKEQNTVISTIANQIAQSKSLKTVSVNSLSFLSDAGKCDYNFHFATFIDFLTLFYYADFIIVSSFHGTAFSINLNKQFITVSPSKFSSRIDSLLKVCSLESRKVTNSKDYMIISMKKIDYNSVNNLLSIEREKSLCFLNDIHI